MSTQIEETSLPPSVLTKSQFKTFRKDYIDENGDPGVIIATVRHDDECGNGHNSFGITAEIYDRERLPGESSIVHANGKKLWWGAGGCCHEEVAKHFPELAPFIKWHLTSTDGPMHYVANTVYHATQYGPKSAWVYFEDKTNGIDRHCVKYLDIDEAQKVCKTAGYSMEIDPKTAKEANLDHARSSAVWPEATQAQLLDEKALLERLPALMQAFKADVESLGLVY